MVVVETLHREAPKAAGLSQPQPADPVGREATRYLCGAAYTDGVFREAVLARRRDHYRARAPEVGVDVAMVTAHCRRAQTSKMVRDLVICAGSVFLLFGLLTARRYGPPPVMPVLLAWLFAWIVTLVEAFMQDGVIRGTLTREAFQQQKTQSPPPEDDGNVVVYSGFSPFVGSGQDLGGWSFAVDLDRGKSDGQGRPRPFELEELYRCVIDGFEALNLAHVKLNRKLFVSGRAIRDDRRFLPYVDKRPVNRVEEPVVLSYVDSTSKAVRHYLCVETVDWSGELAVTLFIHFRKLSSKLFVEVSAFMLAPLKPAYYNLDRMRPKARLSDWANLIMASVFKAPFLLVLAPFATLGRVQGALGRGAHEREQRKQIDEDLLYDFGAGKSVREIAAGAEWRVYFQKLDKEMYSKILQQQLLDSLVDFLDDHGVDTSEIKERGTHILNNGVIVSSGGALNANSLAVGEGAQAKVMNALRGAREKAPA